MGLHKGAHISSKGVSFFVWAPNAPCVSVIGDFNEWDEKAHPMQKVSEVGLWQLFIPGLKEGLKYKFAIQTLEGNLLKKTDPAARYFDIRPKTASILFDIDQFSWSDDVWMQKRGDLAKPLNIYEVHLGSWKQGKNYKDLAHELARYCTEMGYTHVELMGICEHPLDESWGYQVTGYFAPTSRYGTPSDFQYLVNHLHMCNIGVILDWVPAHFPRDDHALSAFDGTPLFEEEHPLMAIHPEWNTFVFDFSSEWVQHFLISSALFWLGKMHIDGLRVDAVTSMLHLDYARKEGEWLPNEEGGNINLHAVDFLTKLNQEIREKYPTALMIAEESTAFEGVTGKLGFSLKWNLGWMNDTLKFFQLPFSEREDHLNLLTFLIIYAYNERFVLVLSHDEVVHEKKSLLTKMPGTDEQKCAGLRLLLAYMMGMPGKKHLFMGGEFGQKTEWDVKKEIDWPLLNEEKHQKLHAFTKALSHLYLSSPALFEKDFEKEGFEWVIASQNPLIYLRKSENQTLLFAHNFLPKAYAQFHVPIKGVKSASTLLCSDSKEFGGSDTIPQEMQIEEEGIFCHLPALSTLCLEVFFEKK